MAILWTLGLASFFTTIVVMTPKSPEIKTEGIVVLTGGDNRVRTGFDILLDHPGTRLLISGVNPKTRLADLIKESGVKAVVMPCCIDLGFEARDTVGNAREIKEWVQTYHLKSIRVITATYHMPRTLFEMKRVIPDVTLYRQPVRTLQFDPFSRKGVRLVLSEYHKTLVTLLHLIQEILQKNILS